MERIYQAKNYGVISILNISNGNIAYFGSETKKIILDNIPGFNVLGKVSFLAQEYKIFSIGFNISCKCNFNCHYCFAKDRSEDSLQIEIIKNRILQLIEIYPHIKRLFIDLSGDGEPLLNMKAILAISNSAIDLKIKTGIDIVPMLISNGSMYTEENVLTLQKNLVLFGASLDGTKDNHDRSRKNANGSGTFDIVTSNLSKIKDNRFVGTSMTIDPEFRGDLIQCYTTMLKYTPTVAIRFARVTDKTSPSFLRNCSYIANEYEKVTDYLICQLIQGDLTLILSMLNGDDYFGKIILRVFTGARISQPCEGGCARFTVSNKNIIFPCAASTSIDKFAFSDFQTPSTSFTDVRDSVDDRCKGCHARFYCGGECHIVAYLLNGNDEGLCYVRKKIVDQAIKLRSFFLANPEYDIQFLRIMDFIDVKFRRVNVV